MPLTYWNGVSLKDKRIIKRVLNQSSTSLRFILIRLRLTETQTLANALNMLTYRSCTTSMQHFRFYFCAPIFSNLTIFLSDTTLRRSVCPRRHQEDYRLLYVLLWKCTYSFRSTTVSFTASPLKSQKRRTSNQTWLRNQGKSSSWSSQGHP